MEIRDIKFLHPIIRTILGEKSNHFDELTQKIVEKFNAKPHINFMNPSSDNLDKFRLEYYSIAMMFLSSFDCSIKTEIQKEISKIRSSNEHDDNPDKCICGSELFVKSSDDFSYCAECGIEHSDEEKDIDTSYIEGYSADKVTRFREILTAYEGCGNGCPNSLITRIKEKLIENGIEQKKISRTNIKRFLDELGERKYLIYVNYIFSNLTGNPSPRLNSNQTSASQRNMIEILMEDYIKIQNSYVKLKDDRKNALRDLFILERLLRKYKIPYPIDFFSQTKGNKALRDNEYIMKLIFDEIGK